MREIRLPDRFEQGTSGDVLGTSRLDLPQDQISPRKLELADVEQGRLRIRYRGLAQRWVIGHSCQALHRIVSVLGL